MGSGGRVRHVLNVHLQFEDIIISVYMTWCSDIHVCDYSTSRQTFEEPGTCVVTGWNLEPNADVCFVSPHEPAKQVHQ